MQQKIAEKSKSVAVTRLPHEPDLGGRGCEAGTGESLEKFETLAGSEILRYGSDDASYATSMGTKEERDSRQNLPIPQAKNLDLQW